MTVYAAIVIGILLLISILSRFLYLSTNSRVYVFLLWLISAFVSLPLFVVISKYSNHILLLLVTRIPVILKVINIRLFYNISRIIFFGIIGYAYCLMVDRFFSSWRHSLGLTGLIICSGVLIRRQLSIVIEWMEKQLDDILGLATSEPTRQTIITIEKVSFLHGIMEPVSLTERSSALQKSIRSIRLREQTGVSVVAIYREGNHIANPSPDLLLLPNDILIIIGTADERCNAKDILLGDESLGDINTKHE